MSRYWILDHDADAHTGTEVLFRQVVGVYPPRDVAEEDIPKLLRYMRQVNGAPRASEHLIRFCGIGCPRTSVAALAQEYGFRERDIKKSLTVAVSLIHSRWREAFFAMYGVDEKTSKATSRSGTEELFLACTGRFPVQDVGKESIPELLTLIRQSNKSPLAAERLIRFFGIGCTPMTLEKIAEKDGVKYASTVKESLNVAMRNLLREQRTNFLALYGEDSSPEEQPKKNRTISIDGPILISDLDFSACVNTALMRARIVTLGDLLRIDKELLTQRLSEITCRECQQQALKEVQMVLTRLDLLI